MVFFKNWNRRKEWNWENVHHSRTGGTASFDETRWKECHNRYDIIHKCRDTGMPGGIRDNKRADDASSFSSVDALIAI